MRVHCLKHGCDEKKQTFVYFRVRTSPYPIKFMCPLVCGNFQAEEYRVGVRATWWVSTMKNMKFIGGTKINFGRSSGEGGVFDTFPSSDLLVTICRRSGSSLPMREC